MGATTLERFAALAARDHGLVVVSTLRGGGTVQASVVNAGVLAHPLTGVPVVGFVTYGRVKLGNLRDRPQATVTARAGWEWATVEGSVTLVGPDDPADGVDAQRLRLLLREVFTAAGGAHDDWDEYDRVMVEQRRTAVLVEPARVYSN
ncbi:TIGR03618 family F420-dependent PPOX class oxidoreductase [Dactylosporangium matsuzakiense]|uniref:PPOX class F420-dependent enzyme n=1 Tax=Dactylosporangium matsuzakiense TaxID=53360 RepID=A0A9W6KWP2_9ACTN|nr:TIGR03618 family F420-dependent PPOX class oxidoreductase [Dactylosporangium matsuzakiense]UWZ48660.1 TIGR03618 family F420-dependent PPOX class oxidoreductase [Dactylosporangium matsuzakiense]GLL08632.1 PPOX class F420-dependent enzyme [Dactylosporangium matsuzakiense]